MSFLAAFLFVLLDNKMGYMKIISVNNMGIFLYSTSKRIIISTIITGLILILLYAVTIPLGFNSLVIRTLYTVSIGFMMAVGYSQDRINRKM